MCDKVMDMSDLNAVNSHIDACLARSCVPPTSPESSVYLSAESIDLSDEDDSDTYTWAGQKRVRVTSKCLLVITARYVPR
jgi:hypothetical protein